MVRPEPAPSGIDKVFTNLCRGLDLLEARYEVNLPFRQLREDDLVGVIGVGRFALEGYERSNPIVAGVALMTHPSEWPTLCDDYPVVAYLQHCRWAQDVYAPYFGDRCRVWPVGIDTHSWHPTSPAGKRVDFLIYDKIRWQRDVLGLRLLDPIRSELGQRGYSFIELRYGRYEEAQYRAALARCNAMIFLCEHESQGLAYQECLASNVPVLAWDQGWCLDPARFGWGQPNIRATSVPYFDQRCGLTFRDIEEFPQALTRFMDLERSGAYAPRGYVCSTLTLEKCAAAYLEILQEAKRRNVATA